MLPVKSSVGEPECDRAAARGSLEDALDALGLVVAPHQVGLLLDLAGFLHGWASRINLTGHKTFGAAVQGLVVEGAALASVLPDFETIADLGSGAGFPGLPLAILRPQCRVSLVEARQRRHHFQKAAIRRLRLTNVAPRLGRVEKLIPTFHSAVIAQAMARPERALRWMVPWVADGGRILIPGSEKVPNLPRQPDVEFEAAERYWVPGSGRSRTIWIGRVNRSGGSVP